MLIKITKKYFCGGCGSHIMNRVVDVKSVDEIFLELEDFEKISPCGSCSNKEQYRMRIVDLEVWGETKA